MSHEYKGWEIDLQPNEVPGGWRITGRLRLVTGESEFEAPLNDNRVFPTKRDALVAGTALARTWGDERIKSHPLSGREASARLIALQEKTFLLWEALRHLRQEGEAEVRRREE